MKRSATTKLSAIALRVLAGLLVLPIGYLLAALLLGFLPANPDWREPGRGVTIFVRSNGVHTWIMVPKVNSDMDWQPLVPGTDLRDPRWGRGNYVGFGYGNRTFYLETPTWGDLTMKNALLAAFGSGRTLIHADHDHDPEADDHQRPIVLTRDQYRKLVHYIRASFEYGPEGRTIPLPGRGYHDSDMFYEAVGPYNGVLTCNEWTGRALRRAGVRTGLWTPLAQSIMWRLD
ncbi:TIGR02117 family protein [Sphingosinicella rhizophila]|uniref:TIGR02117 family protein n=1 Tax=Sphingosinicella rhizophila TaxID=3050082 RepID=A0ABU3Q6I6_9SPHN|nr:TIGR02117 family protein [Sphingosinicella sp. GR2756]MDT9599031.1 TIGR02117 family protein [Sphingosinicella sp. GR2756]